MDLLKTKLAKAGIKYSKSQIEVFQKFHALLLKWNKRTNLISSADQFKIVERHFMESLAVLVSFKIERASTVLDVGSGAGFPAIPISILRPDLKFLLVESKRIKALFLKHVLAQLNLINMSVVNQRCEKIAVDRNYQQCFDFVFIRAVGRLSLVYKWVQNLIKHDGQIIIWKGGNVDNELNELVAQFGEMHIEQVAMDDRFVSREKSKIFVAIKQK